MSTDVTFAGLHHVALPFPGTRDAFATAREFYGSLIGLQELDVPESIAGVMWFDAGGKTELHLYTDPTAAKGPQSPRHPCLRVTGLESLRKRLEHAGAQLVGAPVGNIPGRQRFFTIDPFGNAVEFVEFD
jgi:catechol 2,3-dioxygenase-like lactoylglutathione lyase family enzyme